MQSTNLAEVIEILLSRRGELQSSKSRNDPFHLALVIEGGGMRGVTAGGMVSALEDLGLLASFDSVHGSSAGAAAGAYFVAGQAKIGTSLFYEDLNNRKFINPLKFLWGRAVLDTSYLVDYAMVEKKPFNFERFQTSSVPLHICCTDIDSGEGVIRSQFSDYESYRAFMRASITMPFLGGRSVLIDKRRFLDGGLVQQIAIHSAVAAGATHILTIVTRTDREMEEEQPSAIREIEAFTLGVIYGGRLQDLYNNRGDKINNQLRQLHAGKTDQGVPLAYVSLPEKLDEVGRLTISRDKLRRSASASYDHIRDIVSPGSNLTLF